MSRAVAASTAAVVCLIAAHIVWQMMQIASVPIPARYDYDEGVYAATADALARGDRLYRDVFVSQPPVLILAIREMFALLGTSLAAARSAVVLSSAVWLLALLAILGVRGSPWGGILAVCLLLGRAAFLVKAHTVEMEMPSEALACVAIALAAWGARRGGSLWWAAAGVVGALAIMTKLTAVTCLIPLAGVAVAAKRPAPVWRWGMLAAGGLVAIAALLPVIGTAGFWDQVFVFHLVLARARGESLLAHAVFVARFLAGEWPLGIAAAVGIWRSIRSGGWFERAQIAWLIADCGVLLALTPLWEHHLVILFSPLALLAGSAIGRPGLPIPERGAATRPGMPITQRLVMPVRLARDAALAAGVIAYLAVGVSMVPRAGPSAELRRVVGRIADAVPVDGAVLTDDPMVAFLARRPVAAGLADASLARIWAGQISEAGLIGVLRDERTAAVVFWRGTFHEYFPRLEAEAVSLFSVRVRAGHGRLLLLKRTGRLRSP